MPGVRGGSTESGHAGWVDVSDFAAAILRPSLGSTTSPKIGVKAYLEPGMPDLARLAGLGTVHPAVRAHVLRAATDPRPIMELVLTDPLVVSLSQHMSRGGAGLDLTFDDGRIEWTHIDPASRQRTRGCWDWRTNSGY